MKKKLLITLTAIMGGVIVVLIAQEMTPEQEDRFDLREQEGIQGPSYAAFDAGDREERQRAADKNVREVLLPEYLKKQAERGQ